MVAVFRNFLVGDTGTVSSSVAVRARRDTSLTPCKDIAALREFLVAAHRYAYDIKRKTEAYKGPEIYTFHLQ